MRDKGFVLFSIFSLSCVVFQPYLQGHNVTDNGRCTFTENHCDSCSSENERTQSTTVMINCADQNLTTIPSDLPSLTEKLILSRNLIETFSFEEIVKYPSLKELNLEENKITTITGANLMDHSLQVVNIRVNEIRHLTNTTFQGLKLLLRLDLHRNKISRLIKGTFRNLISLKELDLSKNNISVVEKGTFDGLVQATFINMAKNRLKVISEGTFRTLKSLQVLNLGFNAISFIDNRAFSELSSIRMIIISDNAITFLPVKALSLITTLTDLDMSGNPITFVPADTMLAFQSLKMLNLSFSNISLFHGIRLGKLLPKLQLLVHQNPLHCSCELLWLKEWLESKPPQTVNSHIKCTTPSILAGRTLLSLNTIDFACSCDHCRNSVGCIRNGRSCNCEDKWEGLSCLDTCHFNVSEGNQSKALCTALRGKCYCSDLSHLCDSGSFATHSNLSWECVCDKGYKKHGFLNCTDINECSTEHDLCHKNAECINTEGSFQCVCRNGYHGDGITCQNAIHHRSASLVTVSFSFVIFVLLIGVLIFCALNKQRERNKETRDAAVRKGKKRQSTKRYVDLYRIRELGVNNMAFDEVSTEVDKWEIPRENLLVIKRAGEGAFGLVMEGALATDEGITKVAVKTLKSDADRHDYKDLMSELTIMKQAGSHPNIVNLIGACSVGAPLYLVMEFVSGGNLLAFLRKSRCHDSPYVNIISTLNERDLLKIAEDVAKGMNHLSSLNIVHRELAARNVLLAEDKVAKVTDFGLARDVQLEGIYTKTTTGRLPVKWMAPESIRDHIYTSRSDVWSFGVLLWKIITIGETPYPGIPARLLARKLMIGYRMKKPFQCSDELYEVMKACWQLDPEVRPNFAELSRMLHEFLSRTGRAYINMEFLGSNLDRISLSSVELCEQRGDDSSAIEALDDLEQMSPHENFEIAITPPCHTTTKEQDGTSYETTRL